MQENTVALSEVVPLQTTGEPTNPQVLDHHVTSFRVWAGLIDLIPMGLLWWTMAWASGSIINDENGSNAELENWELLHFIGLSLLYYVLLEGLAGTTLGKAVLGLRVVAMDGGPCSWKASMKRNIFRLLDGLPVGYAVGWAAISLDPQHQRLGDRAARTLVVRANYQTVNKERLNSARGKVWVRLLFALLIFVTVVAGYLVLVTSLRSLPNLLLL